MSYRSRTAETAASITFLAFLAFGLWLALCAFGGR